MDSKKSVKDSIIAHLEGELHGKELERLTLWLSESKENARYYASIKDIWETSVADIPLIAETEKEWPRLLSKIKKNHQSNIFTFKSKWQIFFRFAAVLIIGILIGGLVINYMLSKEPIFITSIAPKGSLSQLVLADSTIVYLNAGSEVRYSPEAMSKKREIFLKGEAWFDVTENKKKPFVVHTQYYDVNVTGTQFNVKSYETDYEITTTLEKGKVTISSTEKFKLAENLALKPGEQVIFDKNSNELVVREVDTKIYTSWKENKLMFLNMSFKELIILLERRYGIDIEVTDMEILKFHYTGTIKNESILEILEIIKHTIPIHYKIEGQKIRISKN